MADLLKPLYTLSVETVSQILPLAILKGNPDFRNLFMTGEHDA